MQVENAFATLLLLLISSKGTFQQFAGCRESFFLDDGECKPCPDRCATCVSDRNCTTCKANYYGPVCQNACQQDCTIKELCHKVHGYCTYGCTDGYFPVPNSPRCGNCPKNCSICKSETECAECFPGYHGITCRNTCPKNCKSCNKTTGLCMACLDKFFNQDGNCSKCPDGCARCTDNENCLGCQAGYIKLINGKCIMECPKPSETSVLDQTTYSKENITSLGCRNTMNAEKFMVKTGKPCIQYTPCSSEITCPSKYKEKSACATRKTYQCNYTCHQLNESYCKCEPNCTIMEESPPSMPFCLTNETACSAIKPSTEPECSDASDPVPEDPSKSLPIYLVPLVAALFLNVVLICVIFYIRKKRIYQCWVSRMRRNSRRENGDVEEVEDLKSTDRVHKGSKESQAETRLNQLSETSLMTTTRAI